MNNTPTDNTPEIIPNTEAPTITPDAPELDYSYELEEGTTVEFYR